MMTPFYENVRKYYETIHNPKVHFSKINNVHWIIIHDTPEDCYERIKESCDEDYLITKNKCSFDKKSYKELIKKCRKNGVRIPDWLYLEGYKDFITNKFSIYYDKKKRENLISVLKTYTFGFPVLTFFVPDNLFNTVFKESRDGSMDNIINEMTKTR